MCIIQWILRALESIRLSEERHFCVIIHPGVWLQVFLVILHGASGFDPGDLDVEAFRHLFQQVDGAGIGRVLTNLWTRTDGAR